jgi:hypothetical protein
MLDLARAIYLTAHDEIIGQVDASDDSPPAIVIYRSQ